VLTKDGTGTLRLSGNSSTAAGRLLVSAGTVLVDGTWASTTSNATYGISVASGATLGGDGAITVSSAKLVVDGVLQAGRGGANQSLTLNTNLEMKIDSVLAFTIGGESDSDILTRTGGSWLFQADQLVKITSLGFTGDEYVLMTGLAAAFGTTYDLSLWRLAPGSNVAGTFRFDNGTLLFDAVPEPSSVLLLGLASGGILAAWRRKRSRF
jgi:autotransporter-associated beta strand protein